MTLDVIALMDGLGIDSDHIAGSSMGGFIAQLLAIFSKKNTRDRVRTISVPTLVIHGAGDLLIPPAKGKETAELIPGARFQLIDGMGHDIPSGLGKLLAENVLAHIRSTTTPARSTASAPSISAPCIS